MPLDRMPDGRLGVAYRPQPNEMHVYVHEDEGFASRVEVISHDTAVNVTQAGLEAYDEELPSKVNTVVSENDLRMR